MEKIDFVLPWVDPTDDEWKKKRQSFKSNYSVISNSDSRFRDFDTLKFVFRSIEKNCPWFNKIYLITEGHQPKWLKSDNPKISVISHQELYFKSEHLPVFNSSSIEMNLPNIKGLSDNFIYLNDDMIFYNSVEQQRFFKQGKAVDFISTSIIKRGKIFEMFRGRSIWISSLNNNLKLINENYKTAHLSDQKLFDKTYAKLDKLNNFISKYVLKKLLWIGHWHHPQPYVKITLEKVYSLYAKEMELSSSNRFRASNDLTHYLYRYWHLVNGEFIPEKHYDGYIKNIKTLKDVDQIINDLTGNSKIKFLCLNDHEDMVLSQQEAIFNKIQLFLEHQFPEKSSFEK